MRTARNKFLLISAILLVLVIGCCISSLKRKAKLTTTFPIRCQDFDSNQSSLIIVPGLNNRSDSFNQLTIELCKMGINPIMLELTGNERLREDTSEEVTKVWEEQIEQAVQNTSKQTAGRPVSILGFSLGGVLALNYTLQHPESVAQLILIAPALTPRWTVRTALGFAQIFPWSFDIPSAGSKSYRGRSATPLENYWALNKLRAQVSEKLEMIRKVPRTLVIVRNEDPLISSKATVEWAQTLEPRAEIRTVTLPEGHEFNPHLLVDQVSFGDEQWSFFLLELSNFLNRTN